jgi:transposase
LLRQSKDFQLARKLKKTDPQRKVLFKRARDTPNFSEYAIHAYVTGIRNSWIGEHIDSTTAQKLATRAYNAAAKVLFGKAKKVRFKGRNQLDSLEGKSNKTGIRCQGEFLEWSGLKLTALIRRHDPVILHGLNSKVKYVRIVRRKYNGKNLFSAQLVCVGKPFQKPKNKIGKGDIGIDIGPSTIAIVGDGIASLEQFTDELQFRDKKIRKLQRKMERSRRANNPENYNANGTIKKGKKQWQNSSIYEKTRQVLSSLERKLAGHRKSLHGKMVNSILRAGGTIKLEKLSYKAFQKLFGKSVGKRAPGMFVTHLKHRAESAGAKVVEIPTYNTKLSQTCQCGRVKKKLLSERVHRCECGVQAQRDLYSAFLAKHIDPTTMSLLASSVITDWASVEPRLRVAWRDATQYQSATGGHRPSTFGSCPEVELIATEILTEMSKS